MVTETKKADLQQKMGRAWQGQFVWKAWGGHAALRGTH